MRKLTCVLLIGFLIIRESYANKTREEISEYFQKAMDQHNIRDAQEVLKDLRDWSKISKENLDYAKGFLDTYTVSKWPKLGDHPKDSWIIDFLIHNRRAIIEAFEKREPGVLSKPFKKAFSRQHFDLFFAGFAHDCIKKEDVKSLLHWVYASVLEDFEREIYLKNLFSNKVSKDFRLNLQDFGDVCGSFIANDFDETSIFVLGFTNLPERWQQAVILESTDSALLNSFFRQHSYLVPTKAIALT